MWLLTQSNYIKTKPFINIKSTLLNNIRFLRTASGSYATSVSKSVIDSILLLCATFCMGLTVFWACKNRVTVSATLNSQILCHSFHLFLSQPSVCSPIKTPWVLPVETVYSGSSGFLSGIMRLGLPCRVGLRK